MIPRASGQVLCVMVLTMGLGTLAGCFAPSASLEITDASGLPDWVEIRAENPTEKVIYPSYSGWALYDGAGGQYEVDQALMDAISDWPTGGYPFRPDYFIETKIYFDAENATGPFRVVYSGPGPSLSESGL